MIKALSSLLALMLVVPTSGHTTQVSGFVSPCPNVFTYQSSGMVSNKWHGTLHLNTDTTLNALRLDIVLDNKAKILGNWIGEVTTNDNKKFKIENTKMTISPDEPLYVPFFIQYKAGDTPPKLESIRFNGKEICQVETPEVLQSVPEVVPGIYREVGPEVTTPTTVRPAVTTTSRNNYKQQTTLLAQYWYQTEMPQITTNSLFWTQTTTAGPPTSTTLKPQYSTEARIIESTTLKPEYWQQTPATLKPIYWTQAQTEVKQQTTTVRTPIWSHVKADNNTVKPTTQRWSQTKTEATPHTTTEHNSVSKGQNWSYSQTNDRNRTEISQTQLQVKNNQTTTSVNRQDESYSDGLPVFYIPNRGLDITAESQCGQVVLDPIPLVANGIPTLEGQWPWQIALYKTQTVDYRYICGGTLVSHKHVITAAHCVTRKQSQRIVDQNTLTVYLGKHNLRTSVDGVQIRFVKQIIVNPHYNASTLSRDVAVLELREPVSYSDWVRPACLWPDNEVDLKNIIGKKGSVVGWGFDDTGIATEELALAEMPVVSQETCIKSYSDFFAIFTSEYTYCAGNRDGTSVCNGDSGGGMFFRMNGLWYLRGLVSLSVARPNEYRCDPTHYVIFTDLAKFLPWIYATVTDF